jgi:putative transposase
VRPRSCRARANGPRRREYGGLNFSQVRSLNDLERESVRLRRAVSDLRLDEVIPQEAARGSS